MYSMPVTELRSKYSNENQAVQGGPKTGLFLEVCTPVYVDRIAFYTVFQKKTPTHIVGYKLRNSCLILIIFDIKICDIIWHRMTA